MKLKQVYLSRWLEEGEGMVAVMWWHTRGSSDPTQGQHLSSRNLPVTPVYANMSKQKHNLSHFSLH